MAARILEDAVVGLLKRRPFYGHFLLGFRRRFTASGPALGATISAGVPLLAVNVDALRAFDPDTRQGLLEHVLKHILHLHPLRRGDRHGGDWDVACDLAINSSTAHLPPGALLPAGLRLEEGLAAEEYYRLLHRRFDAGNREGEGIGNASVDQGGQVGEGDREQPRGPDRGRQAPHGTVDDHLIWQEAASTPMALAEEVVRTMVRDAWRKSGGEVPGEVRELVAGLLAPSPVPWPQVLRQFVASAGRVGRRATWKRAHRRFGQQTPGIRKRRRLNLLVGVDVSDSTNIRELREAFAGELVQIARGRESRLTVLYAGSRIQKIESFRSSEAVAEVYAGGGFTDLRPVFDYARQMQPPPAAVIYLTDGYGEAPERMEFPTLWVLTGEGRKPADWGVELRLDA